MEDDPIWRDQYDRDQEWDNTRHPGDPIPESVPNNYYFNGTPYYQTQRHVLERKRIAVRKAVSDELLYHAKFDTERHVWDQMLYEMTSYVLAERLAPDTCKMEIKPEFEFPASWWQHLKRDHFPAWFKERWPVRNAVVVRRYVGEVRVERHLTYPEASVHLPENQWGSPVYVETMSYDWRQA